MGVTDSPAVWIGSYQIWTEQHREISEISKHGSRSHTTGGKFSHTLGGLKLDDGQLWLSQQPILKPVLEFLVVEVELSTYLITSPSVWSYHLTCDAIASFFYFWNFSPGASLSVARCFFPDFSVPFSATLVRSIGGTDSVPVRASAHPTIRLFATSYFCEHLRIKTVRSFGKIWAATAASESIGTCLMGLTAHQTVRDSTIFLLMWRPLIPHIPSAPNRTKVPLKKK